MTLEKEVERRLRAALHRSRKSFQQTLKAALRTGLGGQVVPAKARRFVVKARPMGLRAGIDPAGGNTRAADLEVAALLEKQTRDRQP